VLAASAIYILCLACAKLALLMFYYALLNVMQFWKYFIYVVSGIITAYTLAIFFALIFACHPIQRNWDPIPQSWNMDYCIDRAGLYLATAITNTTSDIILILIPIQIIWRLRLPVRQKLGIAAIFGVGCL
jgi:steroid 5-alpha reductase family enzyme